MKSFERWNVHPRAWIEINLAAIRENIRRMRSFTERRFMAVVKADTYGMGATVISREIEGLVDCFGVANLSEAVSLRNAGIRKPVMVLGALLPSDMKEAVANRVTITLCNRDQMRELARVTRRTGLPATVHVKVDTGMGRVGLLPGEVRAYIEDLAREKNILLEGIFTHFATADRKDTSYALLQMRRFRDVLAAIPVRPELRHIANSPAILNLPGSYRDYDMVRIGLLMLGVYPDRRFYRRLPLACAVSGYARIVSVKDVPEGTLLSYGVSYRTRRRTRVGIVGIGYADGLMRALSNRWRVRTGDRGLPVLGNVCMDQVLVDLTGTGIRLGDTVQVFGGSRFDIETMASLADTVPQEILCGFGRLRGPKLYQNQRHNPDRGRTPTCRKN